MKAGYPELSRHELPPSSNPERHMSPDMAQMLEDRTDAGVIEAPKEAPSLASELAALDPETRADAEDHLKKMGEPAVIEEVEISDKYIADGIGKFEDLLRKEAGTPETLPDSSGDDGDKTKIETAIATDEPDPDDKPDAKMTVAPAPAPIVKTKAEAAVDDVFASSKRLKMVDNLKKANSEKKWRRDVREVNASAVKQELRDAKLNMKIAEQTYSRRGQRVLRRVARKEMRDVINDRYSRGEIGWLTKQLSRKDVRAKARTTVENKASIELKKAQQLVTDAETNKDTFYDKYGRRSNSLRKNLHRVRARAATARSYDHAGGSSGSIDMSGAAGMVLRTETAKLEEEKRKREAEEARRKAAASKPKRVVVRSGRPTKPVSNKATTVSSGIFS